MRGIHISLFLFAGALLVQAAARADTITVTGRGSFKGKIMFEKGSFFVERTWLDGTPEPRRHTFALKIPASKVEIVELNEENQIEECDSICRMPVAGTEMDGGTVLEAMPSLTFYTDPAKPSAKDLPGFSVDPRFTPKIEESMDGNPLLKERHSRRIWNLYAIGNDFVGIKTNCGLPAELQRTKVLRLDLRATPGTYGAR